jgi:hypothetical protein
VCPSVACPGCPSPRVSLGICRSGGVMRLRRLPGVLAVAVALTAGTAAAHAARVCLDPGTDGLVVRRRCTGRFVQVSLHSDRTTLAAHATAIAGNVASISAIPNPSTAFHVAPAGTPYTDVPERADRPGAPGPLAPPALSGEHARRRPEPAGGPGRHREDARLHRHPRLPRRPVRPRPGVRHRRHPLRPEARSPLRRPPVRLPGGGRVRERGVRRRRAAAGRHGGDAPRPGPGRRRRQRLPLVAVRRRELVRERRAQLGARPRPRPTARQLRPLGRPPPRPGPAGTTSA